MCLYYDLNRTKQSKDHLQYMYTVYKNDVPAEDYAFGSELILEYVNAAAAAASSSKEKPWNTLGNVGNASQRNNQPLFVHANSQNHQMPSMLLNVNPNPHHHHFHHNGSSASSTPVVSPLASPIASPQPSYQASLPAAPSTTSSSTSTNCFSRASHNQLSWPIRSIALPSIPSSNQQETVSAANIVQGQQTQTFLQAQQSHNPFPLLLHHSAQHLQQNHHPLPHVLPQHPLQPSFNNPRTDPTVPPGCREHGFNLIGQKYLLHDQIEGSHLQRCIEVETQNEFVCKVST